MRGLIVATALLGAFVVAGCADDEEAAKSANEAAESIVSEAKAEADSLSSEASEDVEAAIDSAAAEAESALSEAQEALEEPAPDEPDLDAPEVDASDADEPSAELPDQPETQDEEPAEPPAPPAVPKPIALSGNGSAVKNVRLPADGPIIVTASNSGTRNFIAELRGAGGYSDLLVNEIGPVRNARSVAEYVTVGRYKLDVDAEGPWAITLSWPGTGGKVRTIPGKAFRGSGNSVVRVRATESFLATVEASNKGSSNFIVTLIGYELGGTEGSSIVVNEIGPGSWSSAADVPAGDLLVAIMADGAWTLKFSP